MARAELGLVRRRRPPALPGVVGGRRGRSLRDDDRGRRSWPRSASRRAGSRSRSTSSTTRATAGASWACPCTSSCGDCWRKPRAPATPGSCCARRRTRPPVASPWSTPAAMAPASSCHPPGVARIEPRDGLLAHTNHFLDDALAGGEAEQPAAWLPGSRGRLATAQRLGAARPRRGARRARRPRVGSAADLPPCRGSRSARPAARRHGRVARHAPGSPGVARGRRTARASAPSCPTRSDRTSGARPSAPPAALPGSADGWRRDRASPRGRSS